MTMRKPQVMEPRIAKRSKLGPAHLDTVRRLHLAMVAFNGKNPSKEDVDYCTYLADELGKPMWPLLCLVIYADRGFEEVERELGLCARSGKVVFKIALEQVEHRLALR